MTDRRLHLVPPPKAVAPSLLAPLRCVECQRQADGVGHGWRAYIGGGYEGEPLQLGVYCPDCAAREFE
jgi:hypothetical protein